MMVERLGYLKPFSTDLPLLAYGILLSSDLIHLYLNAIGLLRDLTMCTFTLMLTEYTHQQLIPLWDDAAHLQGGHHLWGCGEAV